MQAWRADFRGIDRGGIRRLRRRCIGDDDRGVPATIPEVHAQCASVEESDLFGRTFDAVVASGLMFLRPVDVQALLIHRVAGVLNSNGRFLFTSPQEACAWHDALTGRDSISLGSHVYGQILDAESLRVVGERFDEGHNHYFFTLKA